MIVHDSAWQLAVKRERVSTIIDYHQLSSAIMHRLIGALGYNEQKFKYCMALKRMKMLKQKG